MLHIIDCTNNIVNKKCFFFVLIVYLIEKQRLKCNSFLQILSSASPLNRGHQLPSNVALLVPSLNFTALIKILIYAVCLIIYISFFL
ncbi:hypothetical protein QE152_g36995 [Popillia japonica]|uniref:Uncharacterized protein n=1 Tax=Popillia japonica TaxID=7064 RepID=A0AAW1IB65_POPJA